MESKLKKIIENRLKNAKKNAERIGLKTDIGKMFKSKAELLESILEEYQEAINYTHCCTELKAKQECYKSEEPCKYDCSGLCKESC